MVQGSVPDVRGEEMGPKLMNCCEPEPMGTQGKATY